MDSSPQDTLSLLRSVPPVTRALAVIFALATASSRIPGLSEAVVDNFSLRPMSTIGASKVWNVVTAGFFELGVVKSVINILLFLTMGKWIETSWGGRSYFVYLLLVNTVAGVCTYAGMLIAFFATGIDKFLYVKRIDFMLEPLNSVLILVCLVDFCSKRRDLSFCDFEARTSVRFAPVGTTNGICTALLIAVKQLIPDHEIGLNGFNVSANYLPLLYVLSIGALTIVGLNSLGELLFTLSALQFSWLYLRYFRRKDGIRGDMSEAFAYASLVPEPLRAIVAIFANLGFMLCKPVLMARQLSEPECDLSTQNQMLVSKAASVDAERRRQRALKALDERMSSTTTDENGDGAV